jgi:FKBP-type peptidyl-prolyl cis-trans isomerase
MTYSRLRAGSDNTGVQHHRAPENKAGKLTLGLLVGTGLLLGLAGCEAPIAEAQAAENAAVELGSDMQKASYSIGYSMAANVRREFGDDMDLAAFQAGIADQLGGGESQISEADANAALQALVASRQAAEQEKASQNIGVGREFLAENGQREGVVTLPSGLQYEVLTAAEGDKPAVSDRVTTHYRGTLIDGTQFDSSYDRGQPATFPLDGVIAGWTEALQLMSPGAKWRLFIPPELAYGERAQGPIPANSTLIFDVELIEIK